MNTPTHVLLATATLAADKRIATTSAVVAGSMIPDLSIFILFGYATLNGISGDVLWGTLYWQEPWQTLGAISNSMPVFIVIASFGWILKSRLPKFGRLTMLFGLAALIHLATDFPVHASDAHKHFWPLSDWRFHSPISYWERAYWGVYVAVTEAALGLYLLYVHWQRYQKPVIKLALALCAASYLAVPTYFALTLN